MKKTALIILLMSVSLVFAAEEKVVIGIEGMTCNGCVTAITKALNDVDGVKSADVTLQPQSATVIFESKKASNDKLIQAITALGYKASIDTPVPAIKVTSTKGGCPMAAACKEAGSKAACASPTAAASVKEKAPAAEMEKAEVKSTAAIAESCPSLNECQELIQFHEAMEPMHMAYEEGDFQAMRDGFKNLAERAVAVKNMPLNKYKIDDPQKFDQKRSVLIDCVENLGSACQNDDDKGIAKAFMAMHEAYVDLGHLAK